ncbi:MAG: hypothetical protein BYD32DRAFT_461811 [Podila humilis]|nr:MAG: hypothetical protein BYD32DRAFT_461811 [Podila humilis]
MNPKPKPKPKPLNISAEFNHQAFVTIKKTLKVTLGQNVEPAREKPVAKKTSVKEVTKKATSMMIPAARRSAAMCAPRSSPSRCLSLSQCSLLSRSSISAPVQLIISSLWFCVSRLYSQRLLLRLCTCTNCYYYDQGQGQGASPSRDQRRKNHPAKVIAPARAAARTRPYTTD